MNFSSSFVISYSFHSSFSSPFLFVFSIFLTLFFTFLICSSLIYISPSQIPRFTALEMEASMSFEDRLITGTITRKHSHIIHEFHSLPFLLPFLSNRFLTLHSVILLTLEHYFLSYILLSTLLCFYLLIFSSSLLSSFLFRPTPCLVIPQSHHTHSTKP